MTAPGRAAFTARMQQIADLIDTDETIALPVVPTFQFIVFGDDEPAAVAAIAGPLGGSWEAGYHHSGDDYMHLTAAEAGLKVVISAHAAKVAMPQGKRTVTVTGWTPLPSIAEFVQDPPEVTE